jgi:hypothetical protein
MRCLPKLHFGTGADHLLAPVRVPKENRANVDAFDLYGRVNTRTHI